MRPPEGSESTSRRRISVPGWMAIILALFVCLVAIPVVHGVVPWAISKLTPRYGWENGVPGIWNRFGLIPVAVAAVLLVWILTSALPLTPARVELSLTPSLLIKDGPYRLSRNPMYIAELGLWLGWTFFFGSLCVLMGFLALLSIVCFVIVPREERSLEAAFGQSYLSYKEGVPRWLGARTR
jgi:protein-S-isoprenylcysteine O-methyltransferase Ste14